MRIRSAAVLLTAALLSGGCVQVWNRPGATQAELDRDGAYCRLTAAGIATPSYTPSTYPQQPNYNAAANNLGAMSATFAGAMVRQRTMEDCLQALGWVKG